MTEYSALTCDASQLDSIKSRLFRLVAITSTDCWIWTGAKARGYGSIYIGRKNRKTHRVSYELFVGPIPKGLHLDHICRNPSCCNPAHLEPVTHAENARRGIAGQYMRERMASKEVCAKGHSYQENEYRSPKTGYRHCKECSRQAVREWRRRNSALPGKTNPEWRAK